MPARPAPAIATNCMRQRPFGTFDHQPAEQWQPNERQQFGTDE